MKMSDPILDKAPDGLNSVIANNIIDLRTIIEQIGKIKDMTRKTFEEFRIEQTDEFQRKLRFLTLANRSFKN